MPISSELAIQIADKNAARTAVVSVFRSAGVEVASVEEDHVKLRRGSRTKLKLVGEVYLSQQDFPVVDMIHFVDGVVRIRVEADAGKREFNLEKSRHPLLPLPAATQRKLLHGINSKAIAKYQAACDAFANEIASVINLQEGATAQANSEGESKTCPYCAEIILKAAIKCKHCGERLES